MRHFNSLCSKAIQKRLLLTVSDCIRFKIFYFLVKSLYFVKENGVVQVKKEEVPTIPEVDNDEPELDIDEQTTQVVTSLVTTAISDAQTEN